MSAPELEDSPILRTCPFCGFAVVYGMTSADPRSTLYRATCLGYRCGAESPAYTTCSEAGRWWNRRAAT